MTPTLNGRRLYIIPLTPVYVTLHLNFCADFTVPLKLLKSSCPNRYLTFLQELRNLISTMVMERGSFSPQTFAEYLPQPSFPWFGATDENFLIRRRSRQALSGHGNFSSLPVITFPRLGFFRATIPLSC